jgi:hypothetical protein
MVENLDGRWHQNAIDVDARIFFYRNGKRIFALISIVIS